MTIKDKKELWGNDLFKVFANHITEDGWLTSDWSEIIEKEVSQFDEDYNDNPLFKETYQRMYNLDYKESDCGNFIKPIEICLLSCESCEKETNIEEMSQDGDSNWFCAECWQVLAPVMKAEYDEMVKNGEIEP